MTATTIRPLDVTDRDAWRTLWTDYLAFYRTSVAPEVYDTTFARLTSGGPMGGLLAERDGAAVGLTHFIFHPHCWKVEPVCYLQDLFTVPAARGTGVARALIEGVYARADAEGAPSVYWLTAEDNYAGRMLYDRVGRRSPFIRYNRPA